MPRNDLLRLAQRCVGVADKKSAMPALQNVCLAVEEPTALGGKVRLSATDLYLSVWGESFCDVTRPGSVAVPAKDFLERVKNMPVGPVQVISGEGSQVTVKAVGSPRRYTLHGIPGSEFPQIPKPALDAPSLVLPVELLSLLMARTHFSISSDETRPNVNSGLLEWSGDRVRLASTDGHRLSLMESSITGATNTATMLIPLKAINELKRLAEEAKSEKGAATVTITQSGPNAFFALAGMTFSVKLVDAQFPPYQQVIPAMPDRLVRAPRVILRDALKAVSLAASDRTGGVKLSIAPNVLRVTSESPESGNGFDELSVDYSGPEVTIGFNAKYFLDVLDAISDEEVILGISGELDPAIIRPATESTESRYVAIVMPMRI